MDLYSRIEEFQPEQVSFFADDSAGYRSVIVVHSTRLGPAVGGTRVWHYDSETEAATDALRLARGMTYKNAAANLPLGGGKAVVFARPDVDRRELFLAHGRAVDRFAGRFVTAEDVGTTPADMEIMRTVTSNVAGLASGSGDPSPFTARGVFRSMLAACQWTWDSSDLDGKIVAIQGCGSVGSWLARAVSASGAHVIVADLDQDRAATVAAETGADLVSAEEILSVPADVLSPCALGGILNDQTVDQISAKIVVGAANNQLAESRHAEVLAKRGILYAPDFIANAGGVLRGTVDLLGWSHEKAEQHIEAIFDTTLNVFEIAASDGISTHEAANRLAERRLAIAS